MDWGGVGGVGRLETRVARPRHALPALGVGIIQSFLKDPQGRDNFEKFVQKLTPYRQTLGVVAMVLGGFGILTSIL